MSLAKPLIDKIKAKTAVVCIVGLGYVGLPNAVLIANKGFTVIGADISPRIVDATNNGVSHINDPVLLTQVKAAHATGRLSAVLDAAKAASQSDVILLSVPTPTKGNEPDLTFVLNAAASVGKGLRKGTLVVMESTVYPGACARELKPALEAASGLACGKDFFLAHCPERINPGDSAHQPHNLPRVVGGFDAGSGDAVQAFYEAIIDANVFRVSSMETAELAKLTENTQRDVNIAFMSEIALLCEKIGVDVKEVADACATKWNFYKVLPGAGVGGHCLPNNPYYIYKRAAEEGLHPHVMLTARRVNDDMPRHIADLVADGLNEAGKAVNGSTLALLGVAYKNDVDDVRQAPSRVIAPLLREKGAKLRVFDPWVNETNLAKVNPSWEKTLEGAVKGADAAVFLVAHSQFKKLKPADIPARVIIDACYLFDAADVRKAGKIYRRVGLGLPK